MTRSADCNQQYVCTVSHAVIMPCERRSVLVAFAAFLTLLSRLSFSFLPALFKRDHVASIVSLSEDPTGHSLSLGDFMLIVSIIAGQRDDWVDKLICLFSLP